METPSFDQILDEAYVSGLGEDGARAVQAIRAEHEAILFDQELDGRTSPKKVSPPSAPNIELICHPFEENFAEEDLMVIAKVRVFGRALIRQARASLLSNKNIDMFNVESVIRSSFNTFGSMKWRDAHKDNEEEAVERSRKPDTAAPTRAADWPNGDYLNCLGISIVMAAACELAGLKYMYVNELAESNNFLSHSHQSFVSSLEKMQPGFFARPEVESVFELTDTCAGREERKGNNMFWETPPALANDGAKIRDFHHSVLVKYFINGDWLELDPYGLTFKAFNTAPETVDELYSWVNARGNSTSLAIVDDSSLANNVFRKFEDSFRRLRNFNIRLPQVINDPSLYKQDEFLKSILGGLIPIIDDIYEIQAGQYSDDEAKEQGNLMAFHHLKSVLDKLLVVYAEDFMPGTKERYMDLWRDINYKYQNRQSTTKKYSELGRLMDDLESRIWARIQQSTSERERLERFLLNLPYIIIADNYRETLLENFSIRSIGATDISAEYCSPEFAIGAMYLNHYATWRKDGKVNIASHLAEVSPMQALWHSSMQDGKTSSPKVAAVGQRIAQLKPTQLHPHAYIARALIKRES